MTGTSHLFLFHPHTTDFKNNIFVLKFEHGIAFCCALIYPSELKCHKMINAISMTTIFSPSILIKSMLTQKKKIWLFKSWQILIKATRHFNPENENKQSILMEGGTSHVQNTVSYGSFSSVVSKPISIAHRISL